MKLNSNRSLFIFSLFVAIFCRTFTAHANEIPGYVGNQSFRLTDDVGLSDLMRRADAAKYDMARIDQSRGQVEQQINETQRELNAMLVQMEEFQKIIEKNKLSKKTLSEQLVELKKSPEANKDQITDLENQIASLDDVTNKTLKQMGALKLQSAPLNVRLDQLKLENAEIQKKYENARIALQNFRRDIENYRKDLISSIMYVNQEGARTGSNDGFNDGARLSRQLGNDYGSRDGERDGLNDGTREGQDRYYRRGAEQGERDGASRAKIEGTRDGTIQGTRAGNTTAGNREGEIAGIKRADASDASVVGSAQGKKAGLERSVREGRISGENIGEEETVKKIESQNLNSVSLDGAFVGAFSKRSPEYPGDFNGPSFNPNIYNSKDLLRRAYADGYIFRYRETTRNTFYYNIDTDYGRVYDAYYNSAFNVAANKEYPEYFDQGRREADARAYKRDYPIVKEHAFKIAFDQFNANPNRGSEEFKSSYRSTELSAFNNRYEEIRKINFDRDEMITFKANIAQQTEIFRQKRIGEVTTIYNGNAVLAFVSSEMLDGGIHSIAKFDGVFQPGETTLHNIVIKNFGAKSADQVSLQLDNGAVIKIPSIPARSIVTIKGAGQSQVVAKLGATHTSSLKIISVLTSHDAVEAIHFDRIDGGILKSADIKNAQVNFPFSVNGLALDTQLLKNAKNKLKLSIANNSKRAYIGEMQIKILVNSQSQIVTKEFASIPTLASASSVSLNDAEVLVANENDVYRDLSFSASLELEGVTLGRLSSDLVVMAKAPFFDKGRVPVIVANSEKNLSAFLDTLSSLGGSEKVSVLDLSLADLNSQTLTAGLSGKVLLVVDDASAAQIRSLNNFFTKSKNSTFIFVDEGNTGLSAALTLPVLKDAASLLWDSKSVVFSNQLRASGVEKSSAFLQSSQDNFEELVPLAQNLALTGAELIGNMKQEINRTSFFTSNNTARTYNLKVLAEVMNINTAYDLSGGMFGKDGKIAKMIDNDGTLLINQLKAVAAVPVNEANLSTILPALSMRDTVLSSINFVSGISNKVKGKIKTTLEGNLKGLEDSFKKNLKKFDPALANKAYEKAMLHRPFAIQSPSFPSF